MEIKQIALNVAKEFIDLRKQTGGKISKNRYSQTIITRCLANGIELPTDAKLRDILNEVLPNNIWNANEIRNDRTDAQYYFNNPDEEYFANKSEAKCYLAKRGFKTVTRGLAITNEPKDEPKDVTRKRTSEPKKVLLSESAQNLIAFATIIKNVFGESGFSLLREYYVSLNRKSEAAFDYETLETLVATVFAKKDVSIKDKGLIANLSDACRIDNLGEFSESDESALNNLFKVRFEKRTKIKITREKKVANTVHNSFLFFSGLYHRNRNHAAKKTVKQFSPKIIVGLIEFLNMQSDKNEKIKALAAFGLKSLATELKYDLFRKTSDALATYNAKIDKRLNIWYAKNETKGTIKDAQNIEVKQGEKV